MKADIVFCFLSPLKGTEIYDQFSDSLINKREEQLHDFTNISLNYLFGAEELRKAHVYFVNQVKMFSNGERYDHIVKKIRDVDSVFIFHHYSHILLMIKDRLNTDIHACKSALKEFPYSWDLFNFIIKQAKEKNINTESVTDLLYDVLKIQQDKNQNHKSDVEDITLFICADQRLDQRNMPGHVKQHSFIKKCMSEFFKRNIGLNLYTIFKKTNNFQLCSAYTVTSRFELFLKFRDGISSEDILAGIRFNKGRASNIVYYKKHINNNELKLLENLEKIISGEIDA